MLKTNISCVSQGLIFLLLVGSGAPCFSMQPAGRDGRSDDRKVPERGSDSKKPEGKVSDAVAKKTIELTPDELVYAILNHTEDVLASAASCGLISSQVASALLEYMLTMANAKERPGIARSLLRLEHQGHRLVRADAVYVAPAHGERSVMLSVLERDDVHTLHVFVSAGFSIARPLVGGEIEGDTAIHVIARRGHARMLAYLIAHVPDAVYATLGVANQAGETPVVLARAARGRRVREIIENFLRDRGVGVVPPPAVSVAAFNPDVVRLCARVALNALHLSQSTMVLS